MRVTLAAAVKSIKALRVSGPAAIDRFNDLAKAQVRKDPLFKYFDMDAPVLDEVLIGNSFLNQVQMQRNGSTMVLTRSNVF